MDPKELKFPEETHAREGKGWDTYTSHIEFVSQRFFPSVDTFSKEWEPAEKMMCGRTPWIGLLS